MPVDCGVAPDTYVKCYIKDGDCLRHKKKTRIIRHSAEPIFKQTIKYQVQNEPFLLSFIMSYHIYIPI